MAQGPGKPQGSQKCFVIASEDGEQSRNPVLNRLPTRAPANTRLQIARNQPSQTALKPVPVRVAITHPITAQPARLKHAAVNSVPTEDVKRRRIAREFDEIWPNWSIPLGIRNPYSPTVSRLLGAILKGEVVGKKIGAIDLVIPLSSWKTQGKSDPTGCFRTCLLMVGKKSSDAPWDIGISMVIEKDEKLFKTKNYQNGIDTIDEYLSSGNPIIVGVNRAWGNPGNHDGTTDHFVVVVAKGTDKNGDYYRFFDPGSWNIKAGTSVNNKVYYDKHTGLYEGNSQYLLNNDKKTLYTLTWVRILKKHP